MGPGDGAPHHGEEERSVDGDAEGDHLVVDAGQEDVAGEGLPEFFSASVRLVLGGFHQKI